MKTIVIAATPGNPSFLAKLKSNGDHWAVGNTAESAIAQLIQLFPAEFGITVEYSYLASQMIEQRRAEENDKIVQKRKAELNIQHGII